MNITSKKKIHAIIIAAIFTFFNWLIINNLVLEITLIQWIFVEIFLGFSLKLYNFIITKIQ